MTAPKFSFLFAVDNINKEILIVYREAQWTEIVKHYIGEKGVHPKQVSNAITRLTWETIQQIAKVMKMSPKTLEAYEPIMKFEEKPDREELEQLRENCEWNADHPEDSP